MVVVVSVSKKNTHDLNTAKVKPKTTTRAIWKQQTATTNRDQQKQKRSISTTTTNNSPETFILKRVPTFI